MCVFIDIKNILLYFIRNFKVVIIKEINSKLKNLCRYGFFYVIKLWEV